MFFLNFLKLFVNNAFLTSKLKYSQLGGFTYKTYSYFYLIIIRQPLHLWWDMCLTLSSKTNWTSKGQHKGNVDVVFVMFASNLTVGIVELVKTWWNLEELEEQSSAVSIEGIKITLIRIWLWFFNCTHINWSLEKWTLPSEFSFSNIPKRGESFFPPFLTNVFRDDIPRWHNSWYA